MSKSKKIEKINFFLFLIGWIIVFLLGADFPPPPGFIWLVILILILDIIQSCYLRKYFLRCISENKKLKLFFTNILFYLVGSLIIALCTAIPNFSNSGWSNAFIWVAVVTFVGVLYGIMFWMLNSFLYRLL